VLGELLRVERLERAVLAPDSRDDQRFPVGDRERSEGDSVGKREQLHADAAVRPRRDSSSGKTSSLASEESAATSSASPTATGASIFAPSGTVMKSLPWRVFVARSPSLQRNPLPPLFAISSAVFGLPIAIQTISSGPEFTSVFTGAPSPRPEGSAAASSVKHFPPAARTVSASVVLHSISRKRASPSLNVTLSMSTPWPAASAHPALLRQDHRDRLLDYVRSIAARSSLLISVRRASP
jgi:hypothetical protein